MARLALLPMSTFYGQLRALTDMRREVGSYRFRVKFQMRRQLLEILEKRFIRLYVGELSHVIKRSFIELSLVDKQFDRVNGDHSIREENWQKW